MTTTTRQRTTARPVPLVVTLDGRDFWALTKIATMAGTTAARMLAQAAAEIIEPKRSQRKQYMRWTDERLARLVELYDAGYNGLAIAKAMDASSGSVYSHLSKLRPAPPKDVRATLTPETIDATCMMHDTHNCRICRADS